MIALMFLFLRLLCDRFRPRRQLEVEILALRHQLNILNPVGEAIVWYLHQGGPEGDLPRSEWYKIICFVPSGDV